jgi:hypothetical protein
MIVRWFLVVSLIMSLTQATRRLTAEQRIGPSTCMHEHMYTGTGSWHYQERTYHTMTLAFASFDVEGSLFYFLGDLPLGTTHIVLLRPCSNQGEGIPS